MAIRIGTCLFLVYLGFAQQQNPPAQNKNTQSSKQQKQSAPLFNGQLGTKSSGSTKESATLGFNGIDPNGKVDAKMLATEPTPADEAKVKALAGLRPSPAELTAFLTQGGLKKK